MALHETQGCGRSESQMSISTSTRDNLETKAQEPCEDAIWPILKVRKGSGRPMQKEPDVYQQTNYGVTFRLAKGFAMLRGDDE